LWTKLGRDDPHGATTGTPGAKPGLIVAGSGQTHSTNLNSQY